MRIKVSIKLFGAFFLILAIVVGAMFFSRYLFARNFENYIHQMEMERLQRLIPALQAAYRVHHNWMDIKQDRMRWEHIMRDMLSIDRHDPPPPRDQQGPPGGPPRVVLMDANRQPVVGMPGPGEQDQLVPIHVDGQIVGWLGLNLIIGPIVLDENTRQVTIEGSPLLLTPSEFGLLNVMIASPERVFSRGELLDRFEGYDRTIDSHIKNLRKKISELLPGKDVIQTIYGVGYKLSV
jgi:hypothetical protein